MANKPISMTTLKIIIQGLSKGMSRNILSKQHHVSRNTIRVYEQKIKLMRLRFEDILKLTDGEIYSLLQEQSDFPNEENERLQQLQEKLPYFKQELQKCGEHVIFCGGSIRRKISGCKIYNKRIQNNTNRIVFLYLKIGINR